jgi:hypothetical protein
MEITVELIGGNVEMIGSQGEDYGEFKLELMGIQVADDGE